MAAEERWEEGGREKAKRTKRDSQKGTKKTKRAIRRANVQSLTRAAPSTSGRARKQFLASFLSIGDLHGIHSESNQTRPVAWPLEWRVWGEHPTSESLLMYYIGSLNASPAVQKAGRAEQ